MWLLLLTLTSSTSTVAPVLKVPVKMRAPFVVQADRLISEGSVYSAEGNAVLTRDDVIVYADRIRFDEAAGTALAEGNVTAVEGNTVLTCRRVEVRVPELTGGLEAGELRIKSAIPKALLSRLTPHELRTTGEDQMILTAEQMRRTGERSFEIDGGSFTVCDCGPEATPSWRIDAKSAEVDLDSGAWMYLPVFYAKKVPVFALPVFYFPLGDRRSGLMTPRPRFNPVTGFTIAQPVYFVLGDSWDLTLEGSYLSDRGAGAGLEVRWAPTVDSRGQANASLILDFGERQDGTEYDKTRRSPIPRYAIGLSHQTKFEDSGRFAADLNVLGDPLYRNDFADEFLARQIESSRSRITAAYAAPAGLRIAGGLQLLQDLRREAYAGAGDDLREVALLSGAIPGPGFVRYRFAELRMDAPAHQLVSEAFPLFGEASMILHAFSAPRPELARFVRADLRPSLSLPLSVFGLFVVEPSIALRGTVWAGRFESENVDATRLAAVAKGAVHTTLWRDFGAVAHRVRPEIAYLLIPRLWTGGDDVFGTDDEIDQLQTSHQLRVRLTNDLFTETGARIGGIDAWFGRDLRVFGEDEAGAGNSEIVLRGDAPLFPIEWPVQLRAEVRAAIDPDPTALTDLSARLRLVAPVVTVAAAYEQLDDQMPAYAFVAPEELVPSGTIDQTPYIPLADYRATPFDERIDFKPWSRFRGLTGTIAVNPYEPLTITFDLGLTFDDPDSLEAAYGSRSILRNTRTAVRWDSPCDCWSAELVVTTARDRPGTPGIQFALDLSRLGGL